MSERPTAPAPSTCEHSKFRLVKGRCSGCGSGFTEETAEVDRLRTIAFEILRQDTDLGIKCYGHPMEAEEMTLARADEMIACPDHDSCNRGGRLLRAILVGDKRR